MDNRAIGVFDSGLGGLTTVRRMQEIMPRERIIYFGDTGRVPYGTRGPDMIVKYARQDVAFLKQFDLKAIIVACNTVSAVALDVVAAENDLPMFGVVAPAVHKALSVTRNGRIGVICTAATARSGVYEQRLRAADDALTVVTQACPLFVSLVENGRVTPGDIVIETVAREYLEPVKAAGVDTLILGCTHYPLLGDIIGSIMGPEVVLIDSGAEAANYARTQLAPAEGPGETQYFVSDDPDGFMQLAGLFLQQPAASGAELVEISRY